MIGIPTGCGRWRLPRGSARRLSQLRSRQGANRVGAGTRWANPDNSRTRIFGGRGRGWRAAWGVCGRRTWRCDRRGSLGPFAGGRGSEIISRLLGEAEDSMRAREIHRSVERELGEEVSWSSIANCLRDNSRGPDARFERAGYGRYRRRLWTSSGHRPAGLRRSDDAGPGAGPALAPSARGPPQR